jgi:hypothetical protein
MIKSVTRFVLYQGIKIQQYGQACDICRAEAWPVFPGANQAEQLPSGCYSNHPNKKKEVSRPVADNFTELDEFEF